MCTAIRIKNGDCYFGRTLDVERSYGERVMITPRDFPFGFAKEEGKPDRYAMIGMGAEAEGYPLYFEAANEKGLAMAGLSFCESARYFPKKEGARNVAPFEFIPWVLSRCGSLDEAKGELEALNLCDVNFSDSLPSSPLHWIIADRNGALTVESADTGLRVYENSIGVLTNEPPFDYHMTHLRGYMGLSKNQPENKFPLENAVPYSRGMGAMGLPGDFSSTSRFVRAAFVKQNSVCGESEDERVEQFFHILGSVVQPKGCVRLDDGSLEFTAYSSCINLDKGIYYYTTYNDSRIKAVDINGCRLEGGSVFTFELESKWGINRRN